MGLIIRELLQGEFLHLPAVRPAATVGTISTVMAIGLHFLGFPCRQNVLTAAFCVAGVCGLTVTVIGAIAYAILAAGIQQGNDEARRRWG
jgi:hypothetical protein